MILHAGALLIGQTGLRRCFSLPPLQRYRGDHSTAGEHGRGERNDGGAALLKGS
jgi:hypothetical protein